MGEQLKAQAFGFLKSKQSEQAWTNLVALHSQWFLPEFGWQLFESGELVVFDGNSKRLKNKVGSRLFIQSLLSCSQQENKLQSRCFSPKGAEAFFSDKNPLPPPHLLTLQQPKAPPSCCACLKPRSQKSSRCSARGSAYLVTTTIRMCLGGSERSKSGGWERLVNDPQNLFVDEPGEVWLTKTLNFFWKSRKRPNFLAGTRKFFIIPRVGSRELFSPTHPLTSHLLVTHQKTQQLSKISAPKLPKSRKQRAKIWKSRKIKTPNFGTRENVFQNSWKSRKSHVTLPLRTTTYNRKKNWARKHCVRVARQRCVQTFTCSSLDCVPTRWEFAMLRPRQLPHSKLTTKSKGLLLMKWSPFRISMWPLTRWMCVHFFLCVCMCVCMCVCVCLCV